MPKNTGSFLFLLTLVSVTAKKNVLFIMVDDMRVQTEVYRDHSGFSVAPPNLYTPHLDELAETSTTFYRAYCQVALCGPSRTSLMTSRRPDTSKVYTNNPYWRDTYNFTTFPQFFKEQGYTSVGLGKIFHTDYDSGENGGYDHLSWSFEKGYPFYPPSTQAFWKRQNKASHLEINEDDERRNLMDRDLTNKAKEWLSDLATIGDNFIMSLGYKLPHLPWVTPLTIFEQFDNTVAIPDNMRVQDNLPEPAFVKSAELREYSDMSRIPSWTGATDETLTNEKTIELRQAYHASVSYVDTLIGEVIQELKNKNLYDNTVIIVTSDHGYHLGEHNMWTKNTNFEVAVQVPLFISAPGYRNARTTSKLVELVDLFPNIVELAQLPSVPPCGEVTSSRVTQLCTEGESLVPLLSADTENQWSKGAVFHQYLRGNKMGLSIRTDRYRYTYWLKFDTETQGWDWGNKDFGQELYDLRTDTYENENLARNSDYEGILNDLPSRLETEWKVQMPNSNSVPSRGGGRERRPGAERRGNRRQDGGGKRDDRERLIWLLRKSLLEKINPILNL